MRRGLTPLASTVLLVIISIALGAAVMTWGEEFIEDKAAFATTPAPCADSSLAIISIQGVQAICYDQLQIHAFVENKGATSIESLQAQILSTDIHEATSSTRINGYSTTKLSFAYDSVANGIPRQVRLTPKVGDTCTSQTLILEPIPYCE